MKKTRSILRKLFSLDAFVTVIVLIFVGSFLLGFAKGFWQGMTGQTQLAQLGQVADVEAEKEFARKASFHIDRLNGKAPIWLDQIDGWVMFLPPDGSGFVSNVNIKTSPAGDATLQDIVKVEKAEMESYGWRIIREKLDDRGWSVELTGGLGDRNYHWCARLILHRGYVITATGAALPSKWKRDGAKLTACVDSLRPRGAQGLDPLQDDLKAIQDLLKQGAQP